MIDTPDLDFLFIYLIFLFIYIFYLNIRILMNINK